MNRKSKEPKFSCNSHPDVEAVVLCETCTAMPGCTGYWCEDCDKSMHKMFPDHKRVNPRAYERKMCDKHQNQNTETVFCWETETFHCPLCACESGIKGDTIPTAISKCIKDSKKKQKELRDSLEKLSERKSIIMFELSGEENPNNLEKQTGEIMNKIKTTFNKLRELIDRREKTLLEEVEKQFNERFEELSKEATEISETIERGNENLQTYDTLLHDVERKDPSILKKFLDVKSETERAADIMKKFEAKPLFQVLAKVSFENIDELIEEIENLGVATRSIDLPAAQSFKVKRTGYDHVDLTWKPLPGKTSSITYKVLYKKDTWAEEKWKECYNGAETECNCSNLKGDTSYIFKLIPMYKEIMGSNHSTCSAQTVDFNTLQLF